MQSSHRDSVEISAELLAQLEAIPDKRQGMAGCPITPEMDEAILKFYASKPKKQLAKVLGMGQERLKERYLQLTGGDNGR